MYKVKSKVFKDFKLKSNVNGFDFLQDRWENESTTPMGFLASAYSGCITMSVKGYFLRNNIDKELEINSYTEVDKDNFKIKTVIYLPKKYMIYIPEIEKYVDNVCTVSKFLSDKVEKIVEFIEE